MINLPRSALVLVKSSWGQKLTRKCLHTCNIIITTINFLYIMYGMIMLSTCYPVNLIVKMWLFYWLCPGYAANTFVFLTLFFKILLRRWQNICKIKHWVYYIIFQFVFRLSLHPVWTVLHVTWLKLSWRRICQNVIFLLLHCLPASCSLNVDVIYFKDTHSYNTADSCAHLN